MSDKEKLLEKIEQMSEYDVRVLLMQLEKWEPMPILRCTQWVPEDCINFRWTSEKLGLMYPNLVRQMVRKGYNLPDLQEAMGEQTIYDAIKRITSPELDVITGRKIVDKLFPEQGMNIFDPRRF